MQQQNKSVVPGVSAALVAIFAVAIDPGGPARAADDCVATPNAPAPQGSHWYYHVDRATHRTCWYVGPQGRKVHHATSTILPPDESAGSEATEVATDRAMPAAPVEPSSRQAPPINTRADMRPAAVVGNPAIAPQGPAATVLWPDPPQLSNAGGLPQDGVGAASEQAMPEAATVDVPDADQQEVARPAPPAGRGVNPATAMFMRILLLVAGALAAAGILQRLIFKVVFARRRRIHIDRDDADRLFGGAQAQTPSMFVATRPGDRLRAPIERIDPQVVEDAMQQILRSIQRKAA